MSVPLPPRVATWLLGAALAATDRDAVLGDLVEEHALRARHDSPFAARQWYWGQVYRSILRLLSMRARKERWLGLAAVAIAAYIAISIIEFAGTMAITRLFESDGGPHALSNVAIGLAAFGLGGYAASWVRPGAARALAAIQTIVVGILMATFGDSAPIWYQLTFLIGGPLAALAGGRLALSYGGRTRHRT